MHALYVCQSAAVPKDAKPSSSSSSCSSAPAPLHSTPAPPPLAAMAALRFMFAASFAAFAVLTPAAAAAALGINYGQVADNLPPPQAALQLLRALNATKVKLYDADARVLRAFAGSGVDFTIGVPDRLVPRLAADPSFAASWVHTNVVPHLPATSITALTVGNEVLSGTDPAMLRALLPAMESLHASLASCNLTSGKVAVTTAHSLAVLATSFPPSAAVFRREVAPFMSPLLGFLARTGSPFLVNAYPYFAYKADPATVDLGYALFEPSTSSTTTSGNGGGGGVVVDGATGLRYGNMLHAQVDAVRAAICRANYGRALEIRVSETGWPSAGDGDEAGASPENAARYNGNLMRLVAEGKGTPAAPQEPLQVYVFALFNEDQKPGPASERHYGLFKPDGTPAYDVGVKVPAITTTTTLPKGNATGLVVAQGPGGADGAGPGTGFYTVSIAGLNKVKGRRRQCVESLVAVAVVLAVVSGVC